MKLELAKAGNHNGIILSPEDIQEMSETFGGDVPVTIGHELDDTMPAYGWVKSVEIYGETLIGEIELGVELEEAVAEGRYKNWSIGAGRNEEDKMYLHHVAFLGAVPPMIKDLKIIEMGDTSDVITFASASTGVMLSDRELSEFTALKRKQREALIKKLSDASAGKIPFGKREELLRFADAQLSSGGEETVSLLTEIFGSVKHPVRAGISHAVNTQKAETPQRLFSRI